MQRVLRLLEVTEGGSDHSGGLAGLDEESREVQECLGTCELSTLT